MKYFFITSQLFLFVLSNCPSTIKAPCSCSSSRYEEVSVVCDGEETLQKVIDVLSSTMIFNIDSLTISNTPIEQIPSNAFEQFSIKKLFLSNNGLRSFEQNSFFGKIESSLEEIEIKQNFLKEIPQSGITSVKYLKKLSVINNLIEYIHDNAFLSYQSRESLKIIDISGNKISSIHPTAFLGLVNLTQLSINNNLLTEVPSEALQHVEKLVDLSLSVNNISSLTNNVFPLPNLKSLSMEVNKIRLIPLESFISTPRLSFLYLGNNLLTSIPSSMFRYTSALKVFSVNNNKDITVINSETFGSVPNLVQLELADCSINKIYQGAFKKNQQLQVIQMPRNKLTRIENHCFSELQRLSEVDLSGNFINEIDDSSFSQLPMLTMVDLSGNRLKSVPDNLFENSYLTSKTVSTTRNLFLQGNPWNCDKNLIWLQKWLTENSDVNIEPKNQEEAKCWDPTHMNGLSLRQKLLLLSNSTAHLHQKNTEEERHEKKPDINQNFSSANMEVQSSLSGKTIFGIATGIIFCIVGVCLGLRYILRNTLLGSDTFTQKSVSTQHAHQVSFDRKSNGSNCKWISEKYENSSNSNANVYFNKPRHWQL